MDCRYVACVTSTNPAVAWNSGVKHPPNRPLVCKAKYDHSNKDGPAEGETSDWCASCQVLWRKQCSFFWERVYCSIRPPPPKAFRWLHHLFSAKDGVVMGVPTFSYLLNEPRRGPEWMNRKDDLINRGLVDPVSRKSITFGGGVLCRAIERIDGALLRRFFPPQSGRGSSLISPSFRRDRGMGKRFQLWACNEAEQDGPLPSMSGRPLNYRKHVPDARTPRPNRSVLRAACGVLPQSSASNGEKMEDFCPGPLRPQNPIARIEAGGSAPGEHAWSTWEFLAPENFGDKARRRLEDVFLRRFPKKKKKKEIPVYIFAALTALGIKVTLSKSTLPSAPAACITTG